MAHNFRTLYQWAVPSWLSTGEGEIVLHSLSWLLDAATQRFRDGLTARFPAYAGSSALALLCRDRAIQRGRAETDAHYAARLTEWRYPRGHRVRGSAFALLHQVSEYFGGLGCWSMGRNGNLHSIDVTGAEAYSHGNEWTWDDHPAGNWSRFWLAIDGSALEAPATFEDVQAIRRLMVGVAWRPAGTQPEWVIVTDTYATFTPDATWAHWSKMSGDTQVAARSSAFHYWSLDPAHNNYYAGDVSNFCLSASKPGGGLLSGDDTSFPALYYLPDGTPYPGDPASFPLSVRLLDDGDLY